MTEKYGQGFSYRGMETQPALLDTIDELYAKHGDLNITFSPRVRSYSDKQRGALHVACGDLAQILNDSGLDMQKTMKPGFEIPWSKELVKEHLYKPILKAMTEKTSTEEMDSIEPGKVWDVLCRQLAQKKGITPPAWPSNRG